MNHNPHNNELYLRLPTPHQNIIVTPFRPHNREDESALVAHLNDMRVASWLIGPPFPYKLEDAKLWVARSSEKSDKQLEEAKAQSFVGGCPFSCIREVLAEDDDGITKDILIGGIDVERYEYIDFPENSEMRRGAAEKNLALPLGSPEIEWSIGDWLAASHHGRGIMTAVMKTVLYDWAIPRMNARHFKVTAFAGNHGSVRVFEKLGFQPYKTLVDWISLPESRGGGVRSIEVLSLDLEY
ncbi:hypothetical protein EYZ11_003958 [Aspergillus tanneri]|uniref:N-acetyltransferase domain-containing protein n=1 Tax=Aspergillus tanneri TaxID=1220188 RepID=A0A4S3JLV0_9EURO|nr:uncharacterized protein ATNIH1004_010944 [Aspergillus tanneri]KAA8642005.1 hypothetical protein ATNIH1004_010944 [Aspergillus tanneri]THC96566.1 hypothetical protein EYZ11_003958 [Aspergillus tanneri]